MLSTRGVFHVCHADAVVVGANPVFAVGGTCGHKGLVVVAASLALPTAGAAALVHHDSAQAHKNVDQPLVDGLRIYFARSWRNVNADVSVNLSALPETRAAMRRLSIEPPMQRKDPPQRPP